LEERREEVATNVSDGALSNIGEKVFRFQKKRKNMEKIKHIQTAKKPDRQ